MKNIEKKWLLFIISTFVTFFGIGYTLLKGTKALDTETLGENLIFNDINFYSCIVDTYNHKNATDFSYDIILTDEQLSSISSLNCSDRQITSTNGIEKLVSLETLSISKNQLIELDLSKNLLLEKLYVHSNNLSKLNVSNNTLLKELHAYNNQLTELDLSNNLLLEELSVFNNQLVSLDVGDNSFLTELTIQRNPFLESYYVYKNSTFILGENVRISSSMNWESPTWESDDSNLAIVLDGNKVETLDVGKVQFNGVLNDKYELTNVLNIVEITSSKYVIDEEERYIYVGMDADVETIKENIDISDESVTLDIDLNNNKVLVKYEEEILKEFSLYRLEINKYELLDKSIIVNEKISYDDFFNNVIVVNNSKITYKLFDTNDRVLENQVLNEMELKLYYGENLLDTYNVSNYYLNFDQSIIVDGENKILKNITVGTTISDILESIDTNGEVSVLDNNGNLVDDISSKLGTGFRVKIVLDEGYFMYTFSVAGDVNGDGVINDKDISIISRHIIKKNVITLVDYLLAADYDCNGTIDINDVIKLNEYLKAGDNSE